MSFPTYYAFDKSKWQVARFVSRHIPSPSAPLDPAWRAMCERAWGPTFQNIHFVTLSGMFIRPKTPPKTLCIGCGTDRSVGTHLLYQDGNFQCVVPFTLHHPRCLGVIKDIA